MNWCFLVIIAMLSPALNAATSVIPGPHWWREKPDRPSPSPPYSITGDEAWWHGKTSFSGTVIEPGCIIKMDNPWQSLSFGPKEIKSVGNNYYYEMVLTLRLPDCDMKNSLYHSGSRIKMMFYQSPFVYGDSGEVKIQVVGKTGVISDAGEYLPASNLDPVLKQVEYKLRIISDKNTLLNKINKLTLGVLIYQE